MQYGALKPHPVQPGWLAGFMPCETNLFVRAEAATGGRRQAAGSAAVKEEGSEEDAAKGPPPLVLASSSIAESVLSAIAAL